MQNIGQRPQLRKHTFHIVCAGRLLKESEREKHSSAGRSRERPRKQETTKKVAGNL